MDITLDELVIAIESCKSAAALGQDGMDIGLFKDLHDKLGDSELLKLLNAYFVAGTVPQQWKDIVLVRLLFLVISLFQSRNQLSLRGKVQQMQF